MSTFILDRPSHPVRRLDRPGFTLIELLIVVTILGILAAVIVPRVTSARAQAQQANFTANLRHLVAAATMYHGRYRALPSQAAGEPVPAAMFQSVSAPGAFPLATTLGGYWHVGQFVDSGRWGVGVWWPGTEPVDVLGNALIVDVELDDGDPDTGRFQVRDNARYYWLID